MTGAADGEGADWRLSVEGEIGDNDDDGLLATGDNGGDFFGADFGDSDGEEEGEELSGAEEREELFGAEEGEELFGAEEGGEAFGEEAVVARVLISSFIPLLQWSAIPQMKNLFPGEVRGMVVLPSV